MKIPKGFLKEIYDEQCNRYQYLDRDYIFLASEILLSSCCWNIITIDKLGALAPNIWGQDIAPSGDGKTVIIDHWFIPILEKVEKQIETDDTIYKLWLSDYNKESLIKYLSDRVKKTVGKGDGKKTKKVLYKNGVLYKDEATIFLSAAMNKSYMADIVGVESKLYDGKLGRKITIARGLEEVPVCFKSSIAATTPAIYSLMKTDAFIQGGWNRYDMVIGKEIKPEDIALLDDDFFYGMEDKDEIEELSISYAEKLKKLIVVGQIYVCIDDESSLMWRQYAQKAKKMAVAMDERDLRRGYLQRQAEKALKRAMLYTISEAFGTLHLIQPFEFTDRNGKVRCEKRLVCEKEQMEMAINNQEIYYQYWLTMLLKRKGLSTSKEATTDDAEIDFFEMRCAELGEIYGAFSRKQLVEATKWTDSKKLSNNVDYAKDLGKLRVIFGDESRAICQQHEGDEKWFTDRKISESFKNPPMLFEWMGAKR